MTSVGGNEGAVGGFGGTGRTAGFAAVGGGPSGNDGYSGQAAYAGNVGAAGLTGADYAGVWSGFTDQYKPVEFVIDGIGMVQLSYGWVLPLCTSTTVLTLAAPALVVDPRVSYSLQAPAGMSTAIAIAFQSGSFGTGQITFTLRPPAGPPSSIPTCSGTKTVAFTATKTR